MINWNSEPYNDDFSEDKRFVKILFRPGKAVQTRELNQLQSILQNQIARHGDHVFKNGSMVIPGQISMDNKISYVKLRDVNLQGTAVNTIVDSLVGQVILNEGGLRAEVIFATKRTDEDPATLFVRYVNSGTDGGKVFNSGEELTVENPDVNPLLDLSVVSSDSNTTGIGSICSIQKGVYYINGYFVLVEPQTIVLDKYSNKSTYRVGLKIEDEIVKPEDDDTLLDNSQGAPNFAAPGAHRYRVNLVLEKRALDSEDDKNFVELLRTNEGTTSKEIRASEYSILEQTMARRTYDESGDYTVRDFTIDVREDRDNNRGQWLPSTEYLFGDVVSNIVDGKTYHYVCRTSPGGVSGTAEPTHTSGIVDDQGVKWKYQEEPFYNRGIFQNGDEGKLAIGVEPGKAYVQGYEIQKISTEYVKVNKPRTFVGVQNAIVPANVGNYILVHSIVGAPRIDNFSRVNLRQGSTNIGTTRIRGLEYHGYVNAHHTYKLFLFDVKLNSSSVYLENVTSLLGTSFSCSLNGTFTLFEPQNTSLIYPLPYYAIKSVDQSETLYSVTQRLTATVDVGTATISITGTGGTFASALDTDNYIVFDHNGNIISPSMEVSSGTTLNITGLSMPNGSVLTVFATIRKNGGRKTKTLTTTQLIKSTKSSVETRVISLGKADGLRLNYIKMDPNGFSSDPTHVYNYTLDISDRYVFDNGQTETHYDLAKITLKGSYAVPSGPIKIEFEYFEHGLGDYFTLESYSDQISYKEIPYFKTTSLRDSFDFRPRISDDGQTFTQTSLIPKRGVDLTTDFEYYLGRKSKLCLDNLGKFFVVDGEPSLNPAEPESPNLSMVLYDFELEPYTFTTLDASVKTKKIDNKRYTMRDIGKLEKRIDNLEYYTSLSLLEQETASTPVIDDDGLDRFKNGFIVDSFSGHGVGDTANADYLCSIDMENGELRPFFSMNNINLVENARTDSERNAAGYKFYGDVITLPVIEHVAMIDQPYASRTENVNPFAIFTFLGTVKLNPSSDEWFETERRPDIVNNVEGNFNTIMSLAESSGTLGTVWNSWQTTWTGAPQTSTQSERAVLQWGQSFSDFNARFGPAPSDTRWPQFVGGTSVGQRAVTVETTATTSGQSRSGTRTSVVTRVDRQLVADRVVSTSIIPYIRSRNLLVQVKGLKPNTVFYSYFDDVNVTSYCTPSTLVEYISTTSTQFDVVTNAGKDAKEFARQVNGDSEVCLNTGDVIRAGSVTGIVIGKHEESGKKYLHVVNIKGGSFPIGTIIQGSISGATGRVNAIIPNTQLKSSFNGELNFLFTIPNTNSVRFRTGSREFKLIDNDSNSSDFTSKGTITYEANGILETKQATFNAVRNADLVRESVTDNRTIVQTGQRTVSDTGWYDPLAQTFLVDNKGGAFLTKVDLFFAAKDERIPISIEIREVVNGYPGKYVLPFSRVTLNPSEVNISKTKVNLNGENTPKYDTPTTFTFSSPVYVNSVQEYCLVVLSDSNKYKIWISQMGDLIPDSTRTISEQPYAGVLFKSQNASTWTADQYQDMKFKIYRAKFDIAKQSKVTFINDLVPQQTLEKDPFEFKPGSTKVRVFQKDHGFKPGDTVTISGVNSATLNGIPNSAFNKSHIIPVVASGSSVQIDSYIIDVGYPATLGGYFGGSSVKATRNYRFSTVQPIVSMQKLPGTDVSFQVKTTTYLDGALENSYSSIMANENNTFFDEARVIKNGVTPSCYLDCYMSSTNDSISPVIDTHRSSLVLISHKVDSPTEDTYVYPGFDPMKWTNGSTYVTNEFVYNEGKIYRVVSAHVASSAPTHTDVSGNPYAYLGEYIPFYLPDTASTGTSTYSNYVTRRIKLLNPSTLIKAKISANIPASCDVQIYYRTTPAGSTDDVSTLGWTLLEPEKAVTKVENGNETFFEISYMKQLASFDSIQLKLALKSTNVAAIPRVRDLRVIACA